MIEVQLYEDRTVKKEADGQTYDTRDEVFLGNFRLLILPAIGEWLTVTAYGAPNYGAGFILNVYKVRDIWHEARHLDSTGLRVTDYREQDRPPVVKLYVEFQHTYDGRQTGKTSYPVRRDMLQVETVGAISAGDLPKTTNKAAEGLGS